MVNAWDNPTTEDPHELRQGRLPMKGFTSSRWMAFSDPQTSRRVDVDGHKMAVPATISCRLLSVSVAAAKSRHSPISPPTFS